MNVLKKILCFIIKILPFVSKVSPKTAEDFSGALEEADKRRPLQKKKSWRDLL